jgi:ferrochelatase
MGETSKGVILLNLGGPDSLEVVKPFLLNLFSDREIIKLGPTIFQKPIAWIIAATRAKRTKRNYELIGGGSPLNNITNAQSEALEKNLKKRGWRIKTFVGMKYWSPYINEALEEAANEGISELIALPLFPQYSRATTGSCFKELNKSLSNFPSIKKADYITSWHDHPGYIKALSQNIESGLKKFPDNSNEDVKILFSAHALPQSFIEGGDPYVDHINATIHAVAEKLNLDSWELSFQSRSGPVKWIGPETREVINQFGAQGTKNVLLVPVSFVSDHIETLYEMDILYKKQGEDLGITISRAPSLNTSPEFINALTDILVQTVEQGEKIKTN